MGSHLTNAYIFEQSAERSKFFVPSFNFLTFQCDECVPEIDNFFSYATHDYPKNEDLVPVFGEGIISERQWVLCMPEP